jgi:uncharacterized protein (TIGR00290 family)
VDALLVTVVAEERTVTMHGTPLALIREQAKALKLPLHVMMVPPQPSNATYETCFERSMGPIQASGIHHVIAGDVHLADVRDYRKTLIERIGMTPVFPLFGRDSVALAQGIVDAGVRAVVSSVDTEQLSSEFLGDPYDGAFLSRLPERVDPCGENGEFHTFVTEHPAFDESISVTVTSTEGTGRMRYATLRAEPAHSPPGS